MNVREGLRAILDVILRRNYNLSTLNFDSIGKSFGDSLGLRCASIISDLFVNKFGRIRYVSLNGNCLTDSTAVEIGKGLSVNSTLQVLLLRDNRISDKGASEIGSALSVNETLTKLDLSRNYVQVEGGKVIGEVMRDSNRTLKTLDISENLMSDKVVNVFEEVISSNSTLFVFNFHSNQFRPKFLQKLTTAWDEKLKQRFGEFKKHNVGCKGRYDDIRATVRNRIKARGALSNFDGGSVTFAKLERDCKTSVYSTKSQPLFTNIDSDDEGRKKLNFYGSAGLDKYPLRDSIRIARENSPGGKKWKKLLR